MRDLPDNASIDHLRQQAKDLLAVLRRDDPSASLSTAQTTIAQQHGFPTWAQLKGEVDRRRVQPRLASSDGQARSIAAAFALGCVTGPMTHTERVWSGDTWELTTERGKWVLTELADHVTPAHVEVQSALVELAIGAGVFTPVPVSSAAGNFVEQVDGAAWMAHRWMPLGPTPPQPPPADAAAEGGRILARIHGMKVPAPGPVVPWLTHRWPESQWQAIVDQAHAAGADWADDLSQAIPGFLELDDILDRDDPNPRAIFSKAWHAPSATRDIGDGRLAAIVWEHAGAVPPDWEIGASVMAWSETTFGGYDAVAARAFLTGYTEVAGPVDVTPAMFSSGITAGLNWTISRANIASSGCSDEAERSLADRTIRTLLANPLNVEAVRSLADSVAGPLSSQ